MVKIALTVVRIGFENVITSKGATRRVCVTARDVVGNWWVLYDHESEESVYARDVIGRVGVFALSGFSSRGGRFRATGLLDKWVLTNPAKDGILEAGKSERTNSENVTPV